VTPHASTTSISERPPRAPRRARRVRALDRLWGWLLVFLVAAPFTSPFSTCDVHAFAASTTTMAHHHAVPLSSGATLVAGYDTDSSPVSGEEETFKDDVVLNDVNLVFEPRAERPVASPAQAATSVFRAPLVALRL
jgi:hypothetical protein